MFPWSFSFLLVEFAQPLLFIHIFLKCATLLIPARRSPSLGQTLLLFDSKAEKILALGHCLRSHTHEPSHYLRALMESRLWGLVNICFHRVIVQIPGAPRGWLCPRGTRQHWTYLWNHNRFHQHEGHWFMRANTPPGICSTIPVPPNWIKQLWNQREGRVEQGKQRKKRFALSLPCAKTFCFDAGMGSIPPQQRKLRTIKLFS